MILKMLLGYKVNIQNFIIFLHTHITKTRKQNLKIRP